jgi:RNA polymerase sigma-70 factor (ECF subfamily)
MTSDETAPGADESWSVLRAQAGSRADLERVLSVAQGFLAPRLRAVFAEPADAEDVLQDVLFTICRRLASLNDPRLFRPWAHRIAMRAAWKASARIRQRDRLRQDEIEPDALAGPTPLTLDVDMEAMLHRVSAASRLVLTLHYLDGLTLEATAAELGVAAGTVKSRLAYGLKQLRAAAPPHESGRPFR